MAELGLVFAHYLARYDDDGSLHWGRVIEGSPGVPSSIASLPDDETLFFVCGNRIARYDATGDLMWGRELSSAPATEAWSVATSSDGSPLVAGGFYGNVTFGAGEVEETVLENPNASTTDIFVAKFLP